VRRPGMTGALEEGFADVNGATLYYDVAGNGEPLVLVHAGIADRRMWDGQLEAFLRGLLNFLGIQRAILVGCSIGARTVIDFALAHPARVPALVCPTVSGFESDEESPEEWDKLVVADEALGKERLAQPSAVNRLAEIQAPTLVVAGDLDRPEVDVRAKLLSRSILRAQKVVVNGTAHVPSMEKPQEFNRVVLGFLSGVSGAG
jgi:3-oxoadipate enol-lactonase